MRLETSFGAPWEWAGEGGLVAGDAIEFCQVATQTLNIADTVLVVEGEAAWAWMAVAQCFAGPPETPPAAGVRRRKI